MIEYHFKQLFCRPPFNLLLIGMFALCSSNTTQAQDESKTDETKPGIAEILGSFQEWDNPIRKHEADVNQHLKNEKESQLGNRVDLTKRPYSNFSHSPKVIGWESDGVSRFPLHFEDEDLERGGISWGILQPAVSAGKFIGQTITLPFRIFVR